MRHLLRRRPSASMVVAIAALVVAMSGTAVAASKLVSGNSLIKKNSLSGNRLQNRSVMGSKIKLSSLAAVPNATNAVTAATAKAAPIAQVSYVSTSVTVPDTGVPFPGTATCPAGTSVIGGGASAADKTGNELVVDSYASSETTWTADIENFGSAATTGTVGAICAPAAATSPAP
jgi:hypothetical protein